MPRLKSKDEKKDKKSLNERMSKYIYLPMSRTKISWDIFISLILFIAVFSDFFFTVMGLYPLTVPWIKTIQSIISVLLMMDILFTFLTAYKKEMRIEIE